MAYKILLMGASYGSLLASKLLFGGHSIHLVCLPAEAAPGGFARSKTAPRKHSAGDRKAAYGAPRGERVFA